MRGTLAQSTPVRVTRAVLTRSRDDDLRTQAAALAYQLFLSALALSLVGLAVFGLLAELLPIDVSAEAQEQFENLTEGGLVLGIASFVGLLWTASALANRAGRALAVVHRVEPEEEIRGRLRAIGTTLGLVVLLGALPVLTGLLAAIDLQGTLEAPSQLLGFTATAALEFGIFLLSYVALTPPGVPWRTHVSGAIVMTVSWELFKLAGGLLLTYLVEHSTLLYGTIGAVVGILVMLRLAAGLYLFGAELSAVLAEPRTPRP